VLNASLVDREVFVSKTNSTKSLAGVVVDDIVQISLYFVCHFFGLPFNVEIV
jgi:hypothetical protein